jgi:hypothetical protein
LCVCVLCMGISRTGIWCAVAAETSTVSQEQRTRRELRCRGCLAVGLSILYNKEGYMHPFLSLGLLQRVRDALQFAYFDFLAHHCLHEVCIYRVPVDICLELLR